VAALGNFLISAILSFSLSITAKNIENSFLQNNSKKLYSLFSSTSHLNISFPIPISFSDQLSNQQAYFLFQQVFSTYSTFEFYSESNLPLYFEKESFIFKARWSFRNKKDNNLYVLHIFFYLTNEGFPKSRAPTQSSKKKSDNINEIWKITEIKSERF
jgi:hypothetical protein